MNEAYRRLREGLPERHPASQDGFPTDAKQVRAWVEALPRANQAATLRQLEGALRALAHQRIDGAQRVQLLELLRPVVLDGMALLERQLHGASFPLAPQKEQAAGQLQSMHGLLATGYREAAVEICAPAGSVPMFRGKPLLHALARCLYHGSRLLALSYFLYRTPPAGAWATLHAVEGFARHAGVLDKPVEDIALRHPTSIAAGYGQAVLLALSNPYRFSQREQIELWQVTRDLAEQCSFHVQQPAGDTFAVPQDTDDGPGYIPEERASSGERLLWFDLATLARRLDEALAAQGSGEVMLRFGRGHAVLAQADLLRRLRAGWAHASARNHQRLGAGHALDTVIGLSAVHYHLAGARDFDSFMRRVREHGVDRAAWAHGGDSGRVPIARARVLDQSLGGYRLAWPASEQVRARVGELIGLSIGGHGLRDWMVGVVRWLRYEADGGVHAGVELLARRAAAVAVRGADGAAGLATRPTLRALALESLRGEGGSERFVVPGVLDAQTRHIEVTRAEEDEADATDYGDREVAMQQLQQVHAVQVLENAGDYLLMASAAPAAAGLPA